MGSIDGAWRGGHRSVLGASIVVVATCTAATLLAMPVRSLGIGAAVSVYTLAVVTAAVLGGWWTGLATSILSFLALNYFFTEPLHTFAVAATADVIALVAFLAVSAIIGALVARVDRERSLALRREQETQLVSVLTADVLSGVPLPRVLLSFAMSVQERLGLAWVRVRVPEARPTVDVLAGTFGPGPMIEVAIGSQGGSLSVGRAPDGHLFGRRDETAITTFARQITLALERAALDEDMADARTEAERNEVRAALFSSVTHDLRTPLASIKASLTSLLAEDATFESTQREELLTTALEETDRLNRLVGNLLDLARLRAGALTPSRELVDLEDVVASVLNRMRRPMEQVEVRTMFRPDLPEVFIDPVQMDQAITNVVENAIRVSPHGAELAITAARWQSSVHLRIADHGPGIDPADRDRVFEAFYRGAHAGGSGLGFAITRAVMSVHGGKVWIEATPGGGTTVVLEIPIEEQVSP